MSLNKGHFGDLGATCPPALEKCWCSMGGFFLFRVWKSPQRLCDCCVQQLLTSASNKATGDKWHSKMLYFLSQGRLLTPLTNSPPPAPLSICALASLSDLFTSYCPGDQRGLVHTPSKFYQDRIYPYPVGSPYLRPKTQTSLISVL